MQRRIASGHPDYWDHATLLELAILQKDQQKATDALTNALLAIREKWEPQTTARNLRLIHEARKKRGETVEWTRGIEEELLRAAAD